MKQTYIVMPPRMGRTAALRQFREYERMVCTMNQIERITDPGKGPMDGVIAHVNCMFTKFSSDQRHNRVTLKGQEILPCKVTASYSEGAVSISIPDKVLMVSIRPDELMEVLKEAAEAARDMAAPVKPREGGPYTLYCERCHCWVPDTASAEMKKEGYHAHSHICGRFDQGEIMDGLTEEEGEHREM